MIQQVYGQASQKFATFTPMKWLLCLFSLYILVLAGVPCRADDDCCMGKKCECACHGFVVPDAVHVLPARVPAEPMQEALYLAAALPDFTRTIWQPPKSA